MAYLRPWNCGIAAAVSYLSEPYLLILTKFWTLLFPLSVIEPVIQSRRNENIPSSAEELQKLVEYWLKCLKPTSPLRASISKSGPGRNREVAEARRAEAYLWDAANRYLHANLTDTKTLPISEWKQRYADLKAQRDADYTKLKAARARSCRASKIRKCVNVTLKTRAAGADGNLTPSGRTGRIKKKRTASYFACPS